MTETKQMHITRIIDAPRDLVYRAFTDPDEMARWFGPVGYSTPLEEIVIDARVGGREFVVMVNDADTTERVELESTYTDVIPGVLLAGVDVGPEGGNFRFEFFDEPEGKTRLELSAWPVTQEWIDGASVGWESSFTKLDKLVRTAS